MKPASRCASGLLPLAAAIALYSAAAGAGELPDQDLQKLARSSLEELMQIKVFTVAGTPQSRMSAAAAIYVISGEDIRRSGHTSIAEALRMVPGMYVGRVNSSSWLVGSRGLTGSSLTSTRYLVLVDGRLVYDPLTSTTFWDSVDVVLEDVERIEMIRGPGATVWGANAMNGVINIVTKPSAETLGTLVQLGAGGLDRASTTVRHGAVAGPDAAYRVWAKYASHDDTQAPGGGSVGDQWSSLRAGFRYDKSLDPGTLLTVEGDAYTHPRALETVMLPVPGRDRQFERHENDNDVEGAHLLMRINRGFGADQGWRLRAYVDQTRRRNSRFGVERQTVDLDLRSWRKWGRGQDLMWGGEYLWTRDQTAAGPVLFFDPDRASWHQVNAFVQNTSELVPGKLFATLGSKFTYHGFVGFQVQPSARLWWTPSENQTLWAAVSRPVRMPSRFEEGGQLVLSYADLGAISTGTANGVIIPLSVGGDPDLRPEKLRAYELGHRLQLGRRWVLESSLFYNDYQRLIEPAPAVLGRFTDLGSGRTYGAELNASGQVTDSWRLEGSWSWLQVRIDGPVFPFEERSSPTNMAQLRSYLDIGDDIEVNAAVYHVDRIEQLGVDPYTRFDLGLTWRPRPQLRLELWGQNLLHAGHQEASGAMIPRTLQAQVSFELGQ
jgi:iron complex outermembrane receptor protein